MRTPHAIRNVSDRRNELSNKSAPGRIRTCDLWLRRPTLYPAELRAQQMTNVLERRLARPEGFEPPTYGFEARRSIQLSYGRTRFALDESCEFIRSVGSAYSPRTTTMCEPDSVCSDHART
jgi:hypothetical protein